MFLVGQINNTTLCHRQLNALAGAMKSHKQAKSMIKDKRMLIENSGNELFGNNFLD